MRSPVHRLKATLAEALRAADGPTSSRARPARRREWSGDGDGRIETARAASALSPWPNTHSGSGSVISRPVKNFAAMHPPRHASYEPHEAHAPGLPGSRSDANSSLVVHTSANPASRTLPARNSLVDDEGAGVDVADGVDQTDHASGAAEVEARRAARPSAERWKNESPVSTFGRSSSHW